MNGKFLGKITSAEFGKDSDRGFLCGLQLEFSFNGGGASYPYCLVNMDKPDEYHHFTEEDQAEEMVREYKFIYKLLKDAKCNYVSQLVNKPIEVKVVDNIVKDFRILTEVL